MIQSQNTPPLNISIDLRSDIPIYLQIVEAIRHQLASGQLTPGNQLPTVRALASHLRINFNTVSRAYRLLDETGIISTQQGRGTYIVETASPEITERLRRENLETLSRQYMRQLSQLGYTLADALPYLNQPPDQTDSN